MKDSYSNMLADKMIEDSFSIGYLNEQVMEMEQMCRVNYHRIFLITTGKGNIQIDNTLYPIAGNELFLLSKGQIYRFEQHTVVSGYEVKFGDYFWEKTPASANNCKAALFNNATANQYVSLLDRDKTELSALLYVLQDEFNKDSYINKPDVLAAYLKVITIKIANLNNLLTKGQDNHENKLYREFLELVSKNYQTTHEVGDYANLLGITARKLTTLCSKCSGTGAKGIINGQLIAEAKRSLQFSTRPVKEIAFQLNFATPYHFSHFFKKHTNTSPFQYRSNFAHIGM